MDVIAHTKHGALGHRITIQITKDEEDVASRDTLKQAVEAKALLYCSKMDTFPKKRLVSQALPGRPGSRRWNAWVRVTKRPAENPWNEERRLREAEA